MASLNPKVPATTLIFSNCFNLLLLKGSFNYSETASTSLPNPWNRCNAELNKNTTSNPLKCRGLPQNYRYCKDGVICTSTFGNLQYSKRMLVKKYLYQFRLSAGTFGLYIWPMKRVLQKLKINATANQILKRSTRSKSFFPGIFGLYLDLYIDVLAFLAHYLQITHAVALNHLCNRAIYLSLDIIPPKVYCNHACSWCWICSMFQRNKTKMHI